MLRKPHLSSVDHSPVNFTPVGDCNVSNALSALWRAAGDKLDQSQLTWFTAATDIGLSTLENTRRFAEQIAGSAGMEETVLEGRGGGAVLAAIAREQDAAAALINIGNAANDLLHARKGSAS